MSEPAPTGVLAIERALGRRRRTRRLMASPRAQLVRGGWGRRLLAVLGLGVTIALVTQGWAFLGNPERFPIAELAVNGELRFLSPAVVEAVAAPYLGASFYHVDLHGLRRALEARPWIQRAGLQRHWPETLTVFIREQRPLALWGNSQAIGPTLELFDIDKESLIDRLSGSLPDLSGPNGTHQLVWNRYRAWQEIVGKHGLSIRAIALGERGAWRLTLTAPNGSQPETAGTDITVIVGRHNVDQRLARMARALPLMPRGSGWIERIDLRYRNGFAVAWKPQAPHRARTGLASTTAH